MSRKILSLALPAALLTLLAPGAAPAQGQVATLVRDIAPGLSPTTGSSPRQLLTVGDKIFFLAYGPQGAQQVAVTDGTAAGTLFLDDPCEGAQERCTANPELLGGTSGAGGTGGLLFYTTYSETFGTDFIWRSDGTRNGTYPLTGPELFFDRPSDNRQNYAIAGRRLFFDGCTGSRCALWVSDGSAAGTRLLADLGGSFGSSVGPTQLTALGNRVFFFVSDNQVPELWTSDGTEAGTQKVQTLPEGFPDLLTAASGRLFFTAGPDGDQELWTSDGTAAGTRAVSSFEAPSPFPLNQPFQVAGSRVYFVADDVVHGTEIWVSDGTPAGTKRVTDFGYNTPFPVPAKMQVLGNRLIFFATDGIHPRQLWSTTGTPESTAPVAEISPTSDSPLVAVGARLLFVANDTTRGTQVWVTDGTAAGTRTLLGPCSGSACGSLQEGPLSLDGAAFFLQLNPSNSVPVLYRTDGTPAGTRPWSDSGSGHRPSVFSATDLASLGGRVYYSDTDAAHGEELWSSNGRPGGSRLVADLRGTGASSNPDALTPFGGKLYFTATNELGARIWQSDGTEAATQPLGVYGQNLTAAAGFLFFTVRGNDSRLGLWRTDGTPSGPVGLTGGNGTNVLAGQLVPWHGKLAFVLQRGSGLELWQSDGTPAGTTLAVPLPAGITGLEHLTALGDELYFAADDADSQRTVWRSDGTVAGTRQVSDSIGYRVDPHFVRLGTAVLFFGYTADDAFALWRTDGTPGGTVDLHEGRAFSDQADLTDLVAFGNAVYFFAPTEDGRRSLWKSDGTVAGTVQVVEIGQGQPPSTFDPPPPAFATVVGNLLFFVGDDTGQGRELWKSDGTPEGTTVVRDLFPGFLGSEPAGLTAAGGRLYFTANDGGHGRELWQSDGTAAGTRLVEDLAPGGASSAPTALTVVGSRLFWTADDGLHGRELWTLPLSGPAGCQPGDTRLCLSGQRFQVEIAWKDFAGNTGVGHAVALTPDTGYFWFFSPGNVEAIVKVLDARALNESFWVFYGALSTVEYTLTVTDTQTGLTRRYFNPSGQLASVGDTHGFGPLGAADSKRLAAPSSAGALVSERLDAAAAASCVPAPGRLCLAGGRFALSATWKDFGGHTGNGTAVALTPDTGYFWFFAPTNVEVVAKVLDGRGLNGKFWLFYGALSNVEYTLSVTDTATGVVKTYKNPLGQFGSVADTGAF